MADDLNEQEVEGVELIEKSDVCQVEKDRIFQIGDKAVHFLRGVSPWPVVIVGMLDNK